MPETEHDLRTMPWPTAGDRIEHANAVVIPLGSTEQHARHLPLAVDTLRADHLTAALVEAAPDHGLDLVRLPTLPYGYAGHHMRYPGTVSIDPGSYVEVLVGIGESMATHGADRVIFVNFHGGNREPVKLATDRLQREVGIRVHPVQWSSFADEYLSEAFGEGFGHAGDHETSVVEVYRPDLVDETAKEPQRVVDRPATGTYGYFDEITEQGGLGDPTNADPDVMATIIDRTTHDILDALNADIDAGW